MHVALVSVLLCVGESVLRVFKCRSLGSLVYLVQGLSGRFVSCDVGRRAG